MKARKRRFSGRLPWTPNSIHIHNGKVRLSRVEHIAVAERRDVQKFELLDLCEITLQKVATGRIQASIGIVITSFILSGFLGQLYLMQIALKLPFIAAVFHVQEVVFGSTGALFEHPSAPFNLKV